jgi:hypothetical protein
MTVIGHITGLGYILINFIIFLALFPATFIIMLIYIFRLRKKVRFLEQRSGL